MTGEHRKADFLHGRTEFLCKHLAVFCVATEIAAKVESLNPIVRIEILAFAFRKAVRMALLHLVVTDKVLVDSLDVGLAHNWSCASWPVCINPACLSLAYQNNGVSAWRYLDGESDE